MTGVPEGAAKYGYGFMDVTTREGRRFVGHGGTMWGVSADLRHYVDGGYTVVVLSNYDGAARVVEGTHIQPDADVVFCHNDAMAHGAFLAMRDDPPAALAEAVRRGQAFAEAGAECVFTWGITDADTIGTFAKEVPAPVSVIAGPGSPSVPELQELGVARVSFGSMFLHAAAGGVKRLAEELLGPGTMTSLEGGLSRDEMRALIESRRG